jgi:hypothetical protein
MFQHDAQINLIQPSGVTDLGAYECEIRLGCIL